MKTYTPLWKIIIICIISLLLSINTISGTSQRTDQKIPDNLDQEQVAATIYEDIYDGIIVAQSFKPSMTTLTRVELFILRHGMTTGNLTIMISEDLLGSPIVSTTISLQDIDPDERTWIEFNFNDFEVDITEFYFIKIKTQDVNEYYVRWYGSDMNLYENGYKRISFNNGTDWNQQILSDCCFKTYGVTYNDLEIEYLTGRTGAEVDFGIKNTGVSPITKLQVQLTIDGLFVLSGTSFSQEIMVNIQPGQLYSDSFLPVIGFGPMKATLRVGTEDIPFKEIQKEGFLLFFYVYLGS